MSPCATARARSAPPPGSRPVKAFVEVSGEVHTVYVSLAQLETPNQLRGVLLNAFDASGSPALQAIPSLASAPISFLDSESTPRKVEGTTNIEELRAAKALRIVISLLD